MFVFNHECPSIDVGGGGGKGSCLYGDHLELVVQSSRAMLLTTSLQTTMGIVVELKLEINHELNIWPKWGGGKGGAVVRALF